MQHAITKTPSMLHRFSLPTVVPLSSEVRPTEGLIVLCRVIKATEPRNLIVDRLGECEPIDQSDVIPVALGARCAMRHFSGYIPSTLSVGDHIQLLSMSGTAGRITGLNEEWGQPPELEVLGCILTDGNEALTMKHGAIAPRTTLDGGIVPLICVAGTAMDVGKTAMALKLIEKLTTHGLRVAACKATGVDSLFDTTKMREAGAQPVVSIGDGGLPSTCGGQADVVTSMVLGLLQELMAHGPDVIVVEFGDGILGEYGVKETLEHEAIRRRMIALIVAASDYVAAWGAKEITRQMGMDISIITGPAVNNEASVAFLEKKLKVLAESNRSHIPKTLELVMTRMREFHLN